MITYKFLIQGSTYEPYETIFYFDGKNLNATCTCAAGNNGQYCKHRTELLKGEITKIVSTNKSEINNLLQAFKNSPLDLKLQQLKSEEQQLEQLKKKVDATKKEVAKIMIGI